MSRKVPKVDGEKLKEAYLPPADEDRPKFTDERATYYRLMAKAIWLKCLDCVCGRSELTAEGLPVPRCVRTGCSLYGYRGEVFLEEIRRGSAADDVGEGPRAGDARKGTRKARAGAAVRAAADNENNGNGGPGVSSGPGDEEDPGVPGASGDVARKSRRRASRSD